MGSNGKGVKKGGNGKKITKENQRDVWSNATTRL